MCRRQEMTWAWLERSRATRVSSRRRQSLERAPSPSAPCREQEQARFASLLRRLLRRVLLVHGLFGGALVGLRDGDLRAAGLGPVGVEELVARGVRSFIRVSPEIVTLALKEVGRQASAAVAIVISQRAHKRRRGDAVRRSQRRALPPFGLALLDLLVEVRVKQQFDQVGIAAIRIGDLLKEPGANNPPAP